MSNIYQRFPQVPPEVLDALSYGDFYEVFGIVYDDMCGLSGTSGWSWSIGAGNTSQDIYLIANQGGPNDPKIRYNKTTHKWQFSNNGITWQDFGSGGGSGAGDSGESGYSGYSGWSGDSGVSGYSGTSGKSGYSGYSGFSGLSGFSGVSGYSGASGTSGSVGSSGVSGFSGTSGVAGSSGISGYSGASGVAGSSGISGYSGAGGSGASGYSGFSGDSLIYTTFSGSSPNLLAKTAYADTQSQEWILSTVIS